MTIWASWGPLNADGNPDYSKAASGELKIKGEIPGGRWSSHKVIIDGTTPDSLGFIAITGVLVGQIELFNALSSPPPPHPSAPRNRTARERNDKVGQSTTVRTSGERSVATQKNQEY